jgi:hypothetical protein
LLNQSQWTLATIIEDYAVKNRTRNKVILVPGNVQNAIFLASIKRFIIFGYNHVSLATNYVPEKTYQYNNV